MAGEFYMQDKFDFTKPEDEMARDPSIFER